MFKEYHGNGYAFESVAVLIDYCKNTLDAKTIKAKCLKENSPSKKLIEKLGFICTGNDEKYFYFQKQI
jgi:RimJ/RimL family protein N-acetyltransferase